jgi:predicted RNA-binding protein Jag
MQRQFFSGNSVDQAVMTAARHFGIEPERLSYKVRDKKTGFLNARRKVVIEVDPQTPTLSDAELEARAAKPAEERRPERPRLERPAEAPAPRREDDGAFLAPPPPAAAHDDEEEEDGQQAFGLGVGQAPAERQPSARPANDLGQRPPRPDGGRAEGRGGRKSGGRADGRGESRGRGSEARGGSDRGGADRGRGHGHGGERGGHGGERGGHGRNRRGGAPSQDRRGRPGHDRGPARKGGRGDDRARREAIVKTFEHTWKDGEWRELLSEEGDNVSREVLAFEKAIELILDVMDLDIEFSVSDGEVYLVEFSGEDRDRLVADEGRALKAIEHILPRIVRGMVGEALPCRVDCEEFQASREQELIELAKKAAEEVGRSMKPRLLAPMSPADRRIIHVTLMEDPDVDTQSEGDGFIKRIKIFPVRH